jgi:hypothetical protein
MKKLIVLPVLIALLLSNSDCSKTNAVKYKGKLEIKGICMNYTIRMLEGNMDTTKISANWTDDVTGIHYVNVFGLGSPCNFPSTLKEGDEFYFSIDTKNEQGCAVCMAYYPTPPKKLSIIVVEK